MNKEIEEIVKVQDPAYSLFFNNYQAREDYTQAGSYFHKLDNKDAIIKTAENAREHGLPDNLLQEYIVEMSAWEIITNPEKNYVFKHFNLNVPVGQDMELAITDLVDKAYRENNTFSLTELADMHGRILKMGTKDSPDSMKKFHKIVTLSMVKEYRPVRLSFRGDKSTIIISDGIYIRSRNSEIYFSSSSNGTIRTALNQIYDNTVSSKIKDEIIRQIQDLCDILDFESANRYIKFKNDFVFDTQTQEITTFNSDLFIIRKFEFNYDPAAKCEKWLDFVHSSINSDDIPILQEFFGYVFYDGLPAQNFLVLKGPTRAGKGTTIRVLQSLIGAGNFSAVPASSLFSRDDSGHNLASLEGKMANFDGEVPPRDLLNIANLKKLTGKDLIWANEKYKIPHYFLYLGKLIFALNSLPKIKLNDEEVGSFFSRVLIINYLNSHVEDQNTNLDQELAAEISGIFNWAMDGLKRLKSKNFRFSSNQDLEEKQRLYTLASDPLKVFSEEMIMPGNCEYNASDLYSAFIKFCNGNRIDPSMNVKSLLSFQRKITDILKIRDDITFEKKLTGKDRTTTYYGFCIKENVKTESIKDTNIYPLPEGPVKQSLIEEQEHVTSTDNKEPNNQANQDNPDIIYRKSQALATDISISDVFQRSGYNYYALDKSRNDIEGKAWQSYIMKSQEITRKEFETMRGDSQ